MNRDITVYVGAIGGGGHGEQIVKSLRLASTNYKIIGGDVSPFCPQFGLVDIPVLMPRADDVEYTEAVVSVCKKYGAKIAFHGCEPELNRMSQDRNIFASEGIALPINTVEVIDICMNKQKTADFLTLHGFAPPKTIEFDSLDSLELIDDFPVVVKPSIGGGGSRDTYIAQDLRQLELLANYLDLNAEHYIIQEYVGSFEDEYTVGILHDMQGARINSIAIKRLMNSGLNIRLSAPNRTSRQELGEWLVISSGVSHGEVREFSDIRRQCEEIASALRVTGPLNIQCRVEKGKVRVFEINPRFSGTTSLRAMMGYNEPDVLARSILYDDRAEPDFTYQHGLIIRSLKETIVPNSPPPYWKDL